ncbi:MAG: hypothetical protein C0617_02155 [Desulfuromonas sp.]|uniref:alpha/beta fold hydrolase n=1 Tax=Desulfuromonas sp. TaxID=892 RepID=UPI000CAB0C25|nr:alpha/beta fold hydrolase [Desulfuromonas sp.]PLX86105.1 MAG: hypothetical protein C0617_02155 [Desulfuromonas sp.]
MIRLFLFPALGADERMFSLLGELPARVETPRLPVPGKGQGMDAYAEQVAEACGIDSRDWVGGCSFGGMVASAIARQGRAAGLVLIGGALSSEAVVPAARRVGKISLHLPGPLLRPALEGEHTLNRLFGPDRPPLYEQARAMLRDTPVELIVRGGRLALEYFPATDVPCPVLAVHGAEDRAMAPPGVENCLLVPGAGHGLVVTHPEAVNRFLREVLPRPSRGNGRPSARKGG